MAVIVKVLPSQFEVKPLSKEKSDELKVHPRIKGRAALTLAQTAH